jgi:HK97 family phage major capsid protein
MPSLVELKDKLVEMRDEVHAASQQAGPELDMEKVTIWSGDSYAKSLKLREMNEEMSRLGNEIDRLELADLILKNNDRERERAGAPSNQPPFPNDGGARQPKALTRDSFRSMIAEDKGYKAFQGNLTKSATIELPIPEFKTLITLTTVNAQADRRGPVNMPLEERTVMDLMAQGRVGGNTVEYYEETDFTNAADTRAEGVEKPESAIEWTLRTESVRKIAHWIPATKEALDDVDFLESQIRNRLTFGVVRKEETQVLTGDGNAPNIRGILNRTGIQTQAKGADPTPDAVYKAMQKVRGAAGSGFAEPTGVVFHPNDWTDIKLLRTTDGVYIWGNPSDEAADRIWGLPVRQTTAMNENTGLVGDFRFAEVLRREGVLVTVSTEHASYFIENKVAILAESRLALAVYRPTAFATVTGI